MMSCLFVFNILDDMTHSNKNNGKLIVGAGAMADYLRAFAVSSRGLELKASTQNKPGVIPTGVHINVHTLTYRHTLTFTHTQINWRRSCLANLKTNQRNHENGKFCPRLFVVFCDSVDSVGFQVTCKHICGYVFRHVCKDISREI